MFKFFNLTRKLQLLEKLLLIDQVTYLTKRDTMC